MNGTDKLRDLAHGFHVFNEERLLAIADRIDAEHEREIGRAAQLLADAEKDRDFNYANWQDCKQKVLQHNITIDELDAEIERLKDELAHCIALPKDADNVPWNVGDRDEDGNVVTQLRLSSDGWYVITDGPSAFHPELRCHHHAPTVEDVLREFADLVRKERVELATIGEGTIAEYAAKLKLAEGEDA